MTEIPIQEGEKKPKKVDILLLDFGEMAHY